MPLIIGEDEWERISHGLQQRAEMLELLVADIYGENRLVRGGVLPPELVARNAEFLRPMVGLRPASGHFLHFCAFELGRGPDGGWWVLGDRTQAPSGAGFGIPRLPRCALLARKRGGRRHGRSASDPGQHNETYFEHAYIARYLGFMLLEARISSSWTARSWCARWRASSR